VSTTILRQGSSGPAVKALQEKLNATLVPKPMLVPDGRYGTLTQAAVMRYQRTQWLVVDGIAGQCTQNALFGKETYPPILHTVDFICQPTDSTCWASSTAMMTHSTVPFVIAKTPADLILADGSLRNDSETDDAVTNSRRFATAHHLRAEPPMSWMVSRLRSALGYGPLMFDMLWDVGQYTAGLGSSGHMIVVVGIRGDDDESGFGTTLRIHDPWPPLKGDRYSVGYMRWMQEVPTRTYRVFHRA
jgi:hypothetical protein